MKTLLMLLVFVTGLFTACDSVPPQTSTATVAAPVQTLPPTPSAPVQPLPPTPKPSCPVKVTNIRMVHNLEMDVYATITNVSRSTIIAVSFDANHTNNFGDTLEPYKTALSAEDTLRPGQSKPMHWEILMEENTNFKGRKPGTSEMFLDRVSFSDGQRKQGIDFEGCDSIK